MTAAFKAVSSDASTRQLPDTTGGEGPAESFLKLKSTERLPRHSLPGLQPMYQSMPKFRAVMRRRTGAV